MPEGPSIVILREAVQAFARQKILIVEGNSKKVNFDRLALARIIEFKSWRKHFLICLKPIAEHFVVSNARNFIFSCIIFETFIGNDWLR